MSARRRHLVDHPLTWSPLNTPLSILDRTAGVLQHTGKPVCLYGNGYGRTAAPLDDPDWEVWAINTVPPLDRAGRVRADLWWDLHQRCAQSADDLRWMAALPVPLFTTHDLLDVGPHAVRFPLERVDADVTPGLNPPYACTFAYQIAYALLVGLKHVGLFGIDLAYGDRREKRVEWASTNWWIGYAQAHGVTFSRPSGSRMGAHPHRYGFDYQAEVDDTKRYVEWAETMDDELRRHARPRTSVGG